ncbi:NAD(P)H-dependent oxidoreductase [Pseudovibrio exalbescens]|uniref:NAD(P)H-dependent oxidoreductase n=1 Tax=Pseudovibrio exalbescens TaxID=197461 RepID=UPI002367018F|nr:NAD(P)H-dependent oxidoreductase [Pseudovibrio exalbescens]MDD7910816.1 NAD(P)H-dependent oxidoreductase [Pseudovibrio exalbescens]
MTVPAISREALIEAMTFRHATKVFDPARHISEEDFNTILEAARLSPSSFGFEPWQILVIDTPEQREKLREFSWGANGKFSGSTGQLGTASRFMVILTHTEKQMRHDSDYLQTFMRDIKQLPEDALAFRTTAYKTFQVSDFKITSPEQISDWAGKQAYIALANMMTAAALLGIDSCPIEGFDMDEANRVAREDYGVDTDKYRVCVMAAFGYRASEPSVEKTRRPMAQIVRTI